MEKKCYLISEVAAQVQVEAHVLRYWEEELELEVPRNDLGHRQYTKDNIRQFFDIKKLKEEGYQLKAIKELLQQKRNSQQIKPEAVKKEDKLFEGQAMIQPVRQNKNLEVDMQQKAEIATHTTKENPANVKLEQFRELMTDIVKQAMTENNREVGQEVGGQIGDRVLKEMNYLMRMQDEQDEERYRKLDEAIRSHVSGKCSKEAKKHTLFGREKKLKPKLTT